MRDLIKELGIEELTQEEKDEVLTRLTDSLLQRLILRVYDKLDEEHQKEFDKLTDEGDVGKINTFLGQNVPDLDEIRDRELDELVLEMKDFMAAAAKR